MLPQCSRCESYQLFMLRQFNMQRIVACNNLACKRKMKVSRCKISYSVELTIEKYEKQHDLTVFEKELASHFNDKVDLDQIEDLYGEC